MHTLCIFFIIPKNGTLPVPKSKEFLEEFEKKLKPSEPNPIPYYGHEITKIYELMYRVVNATRGTPAEQWEVIQRAMAVPGLLLTNQLAWRDIQNVSSANIKSGYTNSEKHCRLDMEKRIKGTSTMLSLGYALTVHSVFPGDNSRRNRLRPAEAR